MRQNEVSREAVREYVLKTTKLTKIYGNTTDQSRTRKTTGLGLAIVKRFTEKMGGMVSAELHDDVFTIRLFFSEDLGMESDTLSA